MNTCHRIAGSRRLFAAYVLYGRWLAKKWGIDPAAKTPPCGK